MDFKHSGKIAAMSAILSALLFTGCTPSEPSGFESVYSSDTHLPSSDVKNNPDSSNNSELFDGSSEYSDISSSEEVSDNSEGNSSADSQGSSSSEESTSGNSGESSSGNSLGGSIPNSGSSNSGGGGSNSSSDSQSSSTSSVVKPPEPPVQVVIPDFEVPASPRVNVFTAENGWVDYTNSSKGYISARYIGSKARSKLRIMANGETYTYDLSVGGVVEYFPLSLGNGTYTVIMFEQIEGSSYSVVLRNDFEVNITDPRSPFTYSNRYVYYDANSECVYKAAELCAGKTDNISKISAVFGWITDNISYDSQLAATVATTYYPDPDKTMQKRTGICYDYASLMAAMLRSQGIPTRLVIGYAGSTKHAWNEIYTEQTGWITPELFLANNGYNTADATFYAGAENKKQIAAYISDPANYSALYYY